MRFVKAILDELSDVVKGVLAVVVLLVAFFSGALAAVTVIEFIGKCCDYSALEWYEWVTFTLMLTVFGITFIISYKLMNYLWRKWRLTPRKNPLGQGEK